MVAGAGGEHRDTHTLDPDLPNFERLLASAVIYGPNAAGKTNLLKGLQFMQSVVVNSSAISPVAPVTYAPFKFDILTHNAPSSFEAAFIQGGIRYEYSFSLDAARVYHEQLIEFRTRQPRRLFERSYEPASETYKWKFSNAFTGNRSVWRDATRPNALFLSTAVQLNNSQLLPVFSWFQKRLVPIVGATQLNLGLTIALLGQPGGKERLLPFIREADPGIADVQFAAEPLTPQMLFPQGAFPMVYQDAPNVPPKNVKVTFSHPIMESGNPVDLDISDESNGTQLLFRTAGAWLNALLNGEIMLVDEIETSLHPLLIRFLIGRFHSKTINQQKAQIIFTTHNTSILSGEMFRRDQIWFVEKGEDNATKLYPLSDFSPRKDEVLDRWYMRGRYGALPIIEDLPG
jgi:uncharacterized protein